MRLLEIRSSRHAGEALSTVTSPLQHFNITPWSNPCQSLLAWTHVIGDSNGPQGVSFCSSVPHLPHAPRGSWPRGAPWGWERARGQSPLPSAAHAHLWISRAQILYILIETSAHSWVWENVYPMCSLYWHLQIQHLLVWHTDKISPIIYFNLIIRKSELQ